MKLTANYLLLPLALSQLHKSKWRCTQSFPVNYITTN